MFQVPVPSSTTFWCFSGFPARPLRSVMELAVARIEGNNSALSRARLGAGEIKHEASKNDTIYSKVYQKGKKDTVDGPVHK